MKKTALFILPICAFTLVSCAQTAPKTPATIEEVNDIVINNTVSYATVVGESNMEVSLEAKVTGTTSGQIKETIITDKDFRNYKSTTNTTLKGLINGDSTTISANIVTTSLYDESATYMLAEVGTGGASVTLRHKFEYLEYDLEADAFGLVDILNYSSDYFEDLTESFIADIGSDYTITKQGTTEKITYTIAKDRSYVRLNFRNHGEGSYYIAGFEANVSADLFNLSAIEEISGITGVTVKCSIGTTAAPIKAPSDADKYAPADYGSFDFDF